MTFRVSISQEAEREGKAILEWLLSQHAGDTGLRWFEGMERAIASLAEMPERCSLAPENKEFSFEVRHLLYGRRPHVYRVVFTIEDDTVYILHLWHSRRRLIQNS